MMKNLFAFLLIGYFCFFTEVHAQECRLTGGQATLNFGKVSPDDNKDIIANTTVTCQAGDKGYMRYCMYIDIDGVMPAPGIAPRYMRNAKVWPFTYMMYDIYSDAARGQIIGPPPAGGGYPVYSGSVSFTASGSKEIPMPIYGRVPAGQVLPPTEYTSSQIFNSAIYWAYSKNDYPPSCHIGEAAGKTNPYVYVSAEVGNDCRITAISDLNFGVASTSFSTALTSSANMTIRCPKTTMYQLGMSKGNNSDPIGNRRMVSGAGDFIGYEIYKDAGHTKKWESVELETEKSPGAGEGTPIKVFIYGKVPPPSGPRKAGKYSDTVTATLLF